MTPHGVDYETFSAASTIKQGAEGGAQWISEGTYGESSPLRISSSSPEDLELLIRACLLLGAIGRSTDQVDPLCERRADAEVPLHLLAFMFESCRPFTLTDYAVKRSGVIHYHEVRSPAPSFLSSSLILLSLPTAQDVGPS